MLTQEGEVRKYDAYAVGTAKDAHYFEMARDAAPKLARLAVI